MTSSHGGKLILLSEDGKEVIYEPINNILHVGSDKEANVCLNGLKCLAFVITIDNFGRVSICCLARTIVEFVNCLKETNDNGINCHVI